MPRTFNDNRWMITFIVANFQNTDFKERSYRKGTGLLLKIKNYGDVKLQQQRWNGDGSGTTTWKFQCKIVSNLQFYTNYQWSVRVG